MRYRFNYWMVIFNYLIFELELLMSLFLIFGLVSFNSNNMVCILLSLLLLIRFVLLFIIMFINIKTKYLWLNKIYIINILSIITIFNYIFINIHIIRSINYYMFLFQIFRFKEDNSLFINITFKFSLSLMFII